MMHLHKRSPFFFVLALFVLVISGCAGTRPVGMPIATVEGINGHFFPGQIISLPEGKIISFEELIARLKEKRLVFVGEVHSSAEDHLIEVQILQALMVRKPRPDVAMEFFQVPQQQAIECYFQGKIKETQFLKEAHWRRNWGFPYRFYRPLILATREHNRNLFAINVPRKIVKKVARTGLDNLSPQERNQIARHIDLTNREHRAFLKKVFSQHAHGDLSNFEYFYQAQCVWEDSMAEHIAELLDKQQGPLLVFAGKGHILNRYGIPDRVIRRISVSTAIVVTHAVDKPIILERHGADFVWLTGRNFSWHPGKFPWKKIKTSDSVTHEKQD